MPLTDPQGPPVVTAGEDVATVAAFDFDGTITRSDTLLPFLRSVVGAFRFTGGMLQLSPVMLRFAARRIRNDVAKEAVLTHFLSGESLDRLRSSGLEFATRQLPRMVKKAAMKQLDWHKGRGDRCVLISASLDIYLDSWAATAGFDDVLCSSLEVDEVGRVTGRLNGANCFGPEKVSRLQRLLGETWDATEIYAYGDSRGDRELLAVAQHPFFRTL